MKKLIIILLLLSLSPIVAADGDDPVTQESTRNSFGGNYFSDDNYRSKYTPQQRREFRQQRFEDTMARAQQENILKEMHQNEMARYYSSERASRQYIHDMGRPFGGYSANPNYRSGNTSNGGYYRYAR
jgi:hypothetical protein